MRLWKEILDRNVKIYNGSIYGLPYMSHLQTKESPYCVALLCCLMGRLMDHLKSELFNRDRKGGLNMQCSFD